MENTAVLFGGASSSLLEMQYAPALDESGWIQMQSAAWVAVHASRFTP